VIQAGLTCNEIVKSKRAHKAIIPKIAVEIPPQPKAEGTKEETIQLPQLDKPQEKTLNQDQTVMLDSARCLLPEIGRNEALAKDFAPTTFDIQTQQENGIIDLDSSLDDCEGGEAEYPLEKIQLANDCYAMAFLGFHTPTINKFDISK